MKVEISYDKIKKICRHFVERDFKHNNYDEIIAVSRGGLTIAHILSKMLNLKVGFYLPKNKERQAKLIKNSEESKKFLVVEDLVAEGRTYKEVKEFMFHSGNDFDFFPFLLDSKVDPSKFKYFGLTSGNWVVFPWEDIDEVKINDRSLFRNE